MTPLDADIVIVGAGPVGLLCAYLAQRSGVRAVIVDGSDGPLQVGRADALNARSLQLLEVGGLFSDLYPLGRTCNTSSVWADGKFVSRQSHWWEAIEGCFHKHFLMLGQSNLEQLIDRKLSEAGVPVRRRTRAKSIQLNQDGCLTALSTGETLCSHFVIGADGARSFVRQHFDIPFDIVQPQLVWAVIDGIITTDFPKVPEIIVFQSETSDVAWIPREAGLDRFYVRMDTKTFTVDEAITKINRALEPHSIKFDSIVWFSQFSVKESVAERFDVDQRVFLAGDSCHIHSVNGGQGLNTGFGDAFNLIWKLHWALHQRGGPRLLQSYEQERKPVALSVVASSGELVRATKFSLDDKHAETYVKIIEQRAGNITGMGVCYGKADSDGLVGSRVFDFQLNHDKGACRLYSKLDYNSFTLLIFGAEPAALIDLPPFVRVIHVSAQRCSDGYWTEAAPYKNQMLLVRPDSYIAAVGERSDFGMLKFNV